YRRIKVNPFLCPVSEDRQDKTLKAQFETKEAKERILAWLVEGSVAWHRDGLGQEPREVTRANSEYRRDQNPLKEFIEDYCVADRRAVDGVHGSRLENIREQYNRECWRYHLDQLNNRSFGSYMKSLGYAVQRKRVEDKKNPVRYYDGIRLKTQVEIADEVEFNAVNERYDAEEREEYETATSSSLAFLYLSVHGRESDAVPCTVYKALFTYSTHLKVDTNLKLVTLHDMWGICENDLPNGTRYTPPPQATQIDTMQSVLRSVIQHVSTADEYALLSDERRLAVIREQTIAQTAQRLNERADHTRQLFDLLLRNDTGFQAQLIPFGGGAWPR
ncbi:MAG: hypothetical protein ACXV2B_05605, partial [Halobacteriota archaeon]